MKRVVLLFSLLVSFASLAQTNSPRPMASLVEFKNGIMKIEMSTCNGRVLPVVTFRAIEEVATEGAYYGVYRATITKSEELPPQTFCPHIAPSLLTIDLNELLKKWIESENGSEKAKLILEKNGMFEIALGQLPFYGTYRIIHAAEAVR